MDTPKKIGRYHITAVLGQGGMGIVYKGEDTEIRRQVAIKMIVAAMVADPDLVNRFYDEVRVTANLHHPNIVTVYDWGKEKGNPYIVMEFLDGLSLDKTRITAANSQLVLYNQLGILIQVCEGLQYAHNHGVIHRDIKPANIVVLQDRTVKIVDFGIARLADGRTTRAGVTRDGQVIGSLDYMSPEQLDGKPIDHRSDIYSSGVVLYHVLTGTPPFRGVDTVSTITKILHSKPRPLSDYLSVYPSELDEILSRALAKHRGERYQSADEYALELSSVQSKLKRSFAAEYIRKAEACLERSDWTTAKAHLLELLSIDRGHERANELLREIQQILRRDQRVAEAHGLRSKAEQAVAQRHYEEALSLMEQAVQLNDTDLGLRMFRDQVRDVKERSDKSKRALARAESLAQTEELDDALIAVSEALALEPEHTKARELHELIVQRIADRSRRHQFESLKQEIRKEISARRFTSALELLKRASVIEPNSHEIEELNKLALSGREQERRRNELQRITVETQELASQRQFARAMEVLAASLRDFPNDPDLLRLREVIEGQRRSEEHRIRVASQLRSAYQLIEAGELLSAVQLLEGAVAESPKDNGLKDGLEQARVLHTLRLKEQAAKLERMREAEAQRQRDEAELARQRRETEIQRERMEAKLEREREEAELERQRNEAEHERERKEAEGRRLEQEAEIRRKQRAAQLEKEREEAELERQRKDAEARRLEQEAEFERQRREAEHQREQREAEEKLRQQQEEEARRKRAAELAILEQQRLEQEAQRKREDAETRRQRELDQRNADRRQVLERLDALEKRYEGTQPSKLELRQEAESVAAQLVDDPEVKQALARITRLYDVHQSRVPIEPPLQATVIFDPDASPDVAEAKRAASPDNATVVYKLEGESRAGVLPSAAEKAKDERRVGLPFRILIVSGFVVALAAAAFVAKRWNHPSALAPHQFEVKVDSDPAHARIHVKGTNLSCDTPCTGLMLAPGSYEIEATLEKYQPKTQSVNILDQAAGVYFVLRPVPLVEPTAKPTPLVSLLIRTDPGAIVTVDDKAYKIKDDGTVKADVSSNSTHMVRVKKGGYKPIEQAVAVGADNKRLRLPPLELLSVKTDERSAVNTPTPAPPPTAAASLDTTESEWNQVKDSDNPVNLQSFVDRHPNGPHADAARSMIDQLDGRRALTDPSRSKLQAYLEKHPNGQSVQLCRDALDGLDWKDVESSNDPVKLQEFAESHPNSRFKSQAVARISELRKSTPAPHKTDDDLGAIQNVLYTYAGALQDRNLTRLRLVWPALTDKQFAKMKESFHDAESIQVVLKIRQGPIVDSNGASAHVTCDELITVKVQGSSQPMPRIAAFTLIKDTVKGWYIESVTTEKK